MRNAYPHLASCLAIALSLLAGSSFAQNEAPTANDINIKTTDVKTDAAKTDVVKNQPAKKMVQDASITLQTTITGNQEQPKVMYILPWQSPNAAVVDFEPLNSEQNAVFGHVEREELRRELEAADTIKD